MNAPSRPKLTGVFFQWALVDLAGMGILALGGYYLIKERSFLPGFPSSTEEAIAVVLVGIGLIVAAAVKMLNEVMAQAPASGQAHDSPQK